MRGKGLVDRAAVIIKGITPAYAGKSNAIVEGIKNLPDHPRLCGEKLNLNSNCEKNLGSPPPMRGKGFDADCVGVRPGITPAYAGKSRGEP